MVSLYIPAHNAGATLGACLDGVIRQTRQPDEIIVVDDGSTDHTAQIARAAGVVLLQHRHNRGVATARNTAIRAAAGELVASLDADLVVPPDWLMRMLDNFNRRRRIVGCCGQVIEKHTATVADRWRGTHMKLSFGGRRSYNPRWLYCGISLIRRDAMMEAGLFDERCLTAYEDVDLSERLRAYGHTLLYDPTVVATHLKRSTPGEVVRGFWGYWAAKNEMEGAYESPADAGRLMLRRQMGIAAYRLAVDLRLHRYELLPLDLLIPLTFCVRDIEKMVQLKTLARCDQQVISRHLVDECRKVCKKHFSTTPPREWFGLAFGNGVMPNGHLARMRRPIAAYLRTFAARFDRVLADISSRDRLRILEHLPAVLDEAHAPRARFAHPGLESTAPVGGYASD